ncbi:MAG TPA: signal peptidase I [Thermoplasmata archaeon]|nr:signal peptidase I [Thermoplasmata archaeon]
MPGAPFDAPSRDPPPTGRHWWLSRRVEVHDESMLPTLRPGDRLLVDPRAYRDRLPAVGDIVVLVDPEAPDRWLIKRIAGVGPGRFWKTRTGVIPAPSESVGGEPVPPAESVELITLARATVYVTGDAPTARDSRRFGPIRLDALVGRAYRCYAPPDRRRSL